TSRPRHPGRRALLLGVDDHLEADNVVDLTLTVDHAPVVAVDFELTGEHERVTGRGHRRRHGHRLGPAEHRQVADDVVPLGRLLPGQRELGLGGDHRDGQQDGEDDGERGTIHRALLCGGTKRSPPPDIRSGGTNDRDELESGRYLVYSFTAPRGSPYSSFRRTP